MAVVVVVVVVTSRSCWKLLSMLPQLCLRLYLVDFSVYLYSWRSKPDSESTKLGLTQLLTGVPGRKLSNSPYLLVGNTNRLRYTLCFFSIHTHSIDQSINQSITLLERFMRITRCCRCCWSPWSEDGRRRKVKETLECAHARHDRATRPRGGFRNKSEDPKNANRVPTMHARLQTDRD
jgi:hypothetical protein